jgi:hypothetical protein
MAGSLFQQAVHKVKEAFDSPKENEKNSLHSGTQKAEGAEAGNSLDLKMMQSLLTGSMTAEAQKKTAGLQRVFQATEQAPASDNKQTENRNIVGAVISSAAAGMSPEDQHEFQNFRQTLGVEGVSEQTGAPHSSSVQQMDIAPETVNHAANEADAEEKRQLNELAEELSSQKL